MNGRIVAGFLVATALAVGAGVYYTQEYAYYRTIQPGTERARIRLTDRTGALRDVPIRDFQGIDADSSPLRYRACFRIDLPTEELTRDFTPWPQAEPRIAPRHFPCFDAVRIGNDLEAGLALAFLAERDIAPGVDRVVAVYPDGRAYAWHQLNESAE
ncbi:hypothetical protein LV82_01179 [Albidovulum inexpectatum]|uniref:Histidine kinase n=1 Tax=Albidovulum inexpectatum TaxID=196587 RepID=A0A2S5JHY9_9RHOB|nr:DUF6446 family protein [Albidovulum inexpectatum]PPB81137.1 hypothetical protein LV82_01179 [Albidovulum inexpectatum]